MNISDYVSMFQQAFIEFFFQPRNLKAFTFLKFICDTSFIMEERVASKDYKLPPFCILHINCGSFAREEP